MEEFLPIRLFAKREMDEQKVEGGGGNDTPNWVLVGDELTSRSMSLISGLEKGLTERAHNPDLPYDGHGDNARNALKSPQGRHREYFQYGLRGRGHFDQ